MDPKQILVQVVVLCIRYKCNVKSKIQNFLIQNFEKHVKLFWVQGLFQKKKLLPFLKQD